MDGIRSDIYGHKVDLANDNSASSLACRFVGGRKPVVLDVGCACGDLGVAMKGRVGATLYGMELNAGSVALARKTRAYKRVIRANLDELNAESFPDFAGKFDYVVCADVLEHLRDPMGTLSVLKTYLKQGGYIIASIPNVAHMSIKANLLVDDFTYTPVGLLDCTHIHLFTHKSIASGLADIGLRIDTCKFTMHRKNAWQPYDPYPELPRSVKRYLFNDWHSYVCQYVMRLSVSDLPGDALRTENRTRIRLDGRTAPAFMKAYRKQLLQDFKERKV